MAQRTEPQQVQQKQPSPGQAQPLSQEQYLTPLADSEPSSQVSSSTMKNFDMMYTTSRCNVRLHLGSSSGPCTYYVQSVILSAHPQLHLHRGNNKSAPMVAFVRGSYVSRKMTMGLGDCDNDPAIQLTWEELRRERNSLRRSDYEFSASIGSSGPRQTYRWRRDKQHYAKTIYECVDDSGQVVAQLLSGGFYNFNKGGETKVVEGLGVELEALLIISALAVWVFEAGWSVFQGYPSKGAKVERRRRSSSSSGATDPVKKQV